MIPTMILQFKPYLFLNMFLAAGDLLVFEPSSLVVEYGSQASANCSTTSSHKGIGWEASEGAVDMVQTVRHLTWTVPSVTHWDIKPLCYMNLEDGEQIEKVLPVTIYS